MTATDILPFGTVIAWDALLVQFIILPFFSKSENLHKDYIDSGALDAALSYIESQKLIPTLATMFETAMASQGNQKKKMKMKDLLQSVDFLPDLEKAEVAMREKKTLEDVFEKLQKCAGILWKTGVVHVLSTIAIPLCLLLPRSWYFLPLLILVIVVAVFSLCITGFKLFQFNTSREIFLRSLKSNRLQNG